MYLKWRITKITSNEQFRSCALWVLNGGPSNGLFRSTMATGQPRRVHESYSYGPSITSTTSTCSTHTYISYSTHTYIHVWVFAASCTLVVLLQALNDRVTTFLSFFRIVRTRITLAKRMQISCHPLYDLYKSNSISLPPPLLPAPFSEHDRQSNLGKHWRACKSGHGALCLSINSKLQLRWKLHRHHIRREVNKQRASVSAGKKSLNYAE